MSASAITDNLITMLSAASVMGACQVKTHYAVLETTNACAGVVAFREMESNLWAHGAQRERLYTHQVELFVKDLSGNSEQIERDFQGLFDLSVCSLESNPDFGNEAIYEISQINGSHDITGFVEAGGAAWYSGMIDIRTRVWPTNT